MPDSPTRGYPREAHASDAEVSVAPGRDVEASVAPRRDGRSLPAMSESAEAANANSLLVDSDDVPVKKRINFEDSASSSKCPGPRDTQNSIYSVDSLWEEDPVKEDPVSSISARVGVHGHVERAPAVGTKNALAPTQG